VRDISRIDTVRIFPYLKKILQEVIADAHHHNYPRNLSSLEAANSTTTTSTMTTNPPVQPQWVLNFFTEVSDPNSSSGMHVSNVGERQSNQEETLSLHISLKDIIMNSDKFKEFLAATPGEDGDPHSFGARFRMYATIQEDTEETNVLSSVTKEGIVRVWDVAGITKPGDDLTDRNLYVAPILANDNITTEEIRMHASVSTQDINLYITIFLFPKYSSPTDASTIFLEYRNVTCTDLRTKKKITRVYGDNLLAAGPEPNEASSINIEITGFETSDSPENNMNENLKLQILSMLVDHSRAHKRATMTKAQILTELGLPHDLPANHPVLNFLRNNRHKMKRGEGMIPVPFKPYPAISVISQDIMNAFRGWIVKNWDRLKGERKPAGTFAEYGIDKNADGTFYAQSLDDVMVIDLTPYLTVEPVLKLARVVVQGLAQVDEFKTEAGRNTLNYFAPLEVGAMYHYSFRKTEGSIPINRIDFHSKLCKGLINLDANYESVKYIKGGKVASATNNLSETHVAYADVRTRIRFLDCVVDGQGTAVSCHI